MERLLAGFPILVDNIEIHSPKLIDIAEIGHQAYSFIANVCISEESNFDILMNYEKELLEYLLLGLRFFTKEKFYYGEDCLFSVNKKDEVVAVLNKDNYGEFVQSFKIANCIEDNKDIRHGELDAKIAAAKKRINEKLGKDPDDDKVTFVDLVSVLAAKHSNLNIMNVWDLTYFQFDNQFKRMQLVDNYDLSVRQILAGVENVKPEHYISKI